MKKKSIVAAAMVFGLVGSTVFPVQAADTNCSNKQKKAKQYIVVGGKVNNLSDIKTVLEDLNDKLQNGNWKDCPTITLPDCDSSENNSNKPNIPDNSQPDISVPDTEVPDNNQSVSDNNKPNIPDNIKPDGSGNEPNVPASKPDTNKPDTNKPETDTNKPETDNEALSYAEQILNLVNKERAKAGLHALKLDTEVSAAASVRAKEIQTSFSHTRPDGRKFSSALTDNGIRFTGAGENIAWGQTSPEQVMEAWMNSDGHRANILNAKFTKLGVGHLKNASGRNYWVQLFTY